MKNKAADQTWNNVTPWAIHSSSVGTDRNIGNRGEYAGDNHVDSRYRFHIVPHKIRNDFRNVPNNHRPGCITANDYRPGQRHADLLSGRGKE